MSNIGRFAMAAAAVLVIAAVGAVFLSRPGGVGGPGPSATRLPTSAPSPTSTPTPPATPTALAEGVLSAGTYVARPFVAPNDSISFTFTVPDGWEVLPIPGGRAPNGIVATTGYEAPDGMHMGFLTVDSLEGDPCHWRTDTDIPLGPTVGDLAEALAAHSGYETTDATDVTLAGFSGKRIDVLMPSGLDPTLCDEGAFWVWADADGQAVHSQGPEARFHLWILDAGGQRVIVKTHDFPGTSAGDQAELQSIVESIRIEP